MQEDAVAAARANIAEYGWHCLHVLPHEDEDAEPFSYTIGLAERFQHPEIAVFGLDDEVAHGVLAECVDLVRGGKVLPSDTPVSDILSGGYDVLFKPISKHHYAEYLGTAVRYFGHSDFDAVALLWPDECGRFPGDLELRSCQADAVRITRGRE